MLWIGGPTIDTVDISGTGHPGGHADIFPVHWLVGKSRK
jgi:hypothetical protein